jgi:hypothetical protein
MPFEGIAELRYSLSAFADRSWLLVTSLLRNRFQNY